MNRPRGPAARPPSPRQPCQLPSLALSFGMLARLRFLAAALVAVPCALRAQVAPDTAASPAPPAPAVFAYLQLGDTVGLEAVRSDSSVARGILLIPGQARIAWDHWLTHGKPTQLVLSLFPLDAGAVVPLRETEYVPMGDSVIVLTRDARGTERTAVAAPTGAIPAFGRSMTQLAFLAYLAAQERRPRFPLFLTTSGKTVTAELEVSGESLNLTVDGLRIETDWHETALLEIRVPSQGLIVRRVTATTG